MITAMDLMRGASGAFVLAVPAALPEGPLVLKLGVGEVTLSCAHQAIAHVQGVAPQVIEALAALPEIGLIENRDGLPSPTHIHHWAHIEK